MRRVLLVSCFVAAAVSAFQGRALSSSDRYVTFAGTGVSCLRDDIPHREPLAAQWGAPERAGSLSASQTQRCLSCHDGTVASGSRAYSGSKESSMDRMAVSYSAKGHPVGVDYREAMRKNPAEYNDPSSNPDIRLENGKVTCVSCHVPGYSPTRETVRPGNALSLCQACHRK